MYTDYQYIYCNYVDILESKCNHKTHVDVKLLKVTMHTNIITEPSTTDFPIINIDHKLSSTNKEPNLR